MRQQIYERLLEGRALVLRYLREKSYGQLLRHLTRETKDYMIDPAPYDRYLITPYTREVSEAYGMEYVNASFVTVRGLRFIACQAPCAEYCGLFLEMVSRSGADMVICLADEADYFGASRVLSRNEVQLGGRAFLLDEVYEISGREVRRIKCLCWADHSILTHDEMDALNSYVTKVDSSPESLKIVHCRAGVGRTGTFIMHRVLSGVQDVTDDIFVDTLLRLRSSRPYLVENTCQIQFLAEAFLK